jgi:hypothetical protein
MKTHSCYFVDRTFQVLAHENVPCADDKAAVSAARKMLDSRKSGQDCGPNYLLKVGQF